MERCRVPAQAPLSRVGALNAKYRAEARDRALHSLHSASGQRGGHGALSIEIDSPWDKPLGSRHFGGQFSPVPSSTASPASGASSWHSWSSQGSELASPASSVHTPSPLSSPAAASRSPALGMHSTPVRGGLLRVPSGAGPLPRPRSRGPGVGMSAGSAAGPMGHMRSTLGGGTMSTPPGGISMDVSQALSSNGTRPVRAMPMASVPAAAAFPGTGASPGFAARSRATSLPRTAPALTATSPPARRAGSRPASPSPRPPSAHAGFGQTWAHNASAIHARPPTGSFVSQPNFQADVAKAPRQSLDDEEMALQAAIAQSLEEEQRRLAAEAAAVAAGEERDLEEARRLSLEEWQPPAQSEKLQSPSGAAAGLAETFAPAQWLSDASLTHGFARLAASASLAELRGKLAGGEEACAELPSEALLLDPATSFWLTLQDDPRDLDEARSSLRLETRELVLCPMTDSQERCKADSGTHWSLLVCWRSVRCQSWRGMYYDSMSTKRFALDGSFTANSQHLVKAASLAERLFGRPVQVESGLCAQQTNSFDCGVYVLLFSQIIVGAVLRAWERSGQHLELGPWLWEPRLQRVTPQQVEEHRLSFWQTLLNAEEARIAGASGCC
eukprot:gb/GFBE01045878.1/.p1 GENE.gb/GFBE01045878.1/~~gb/GFBE01045878.1/.p1  ORF type:complete len:615 (+),score=68.61 gb/GFBE01045878.1/:1-1845(+)